MRDPANVPYKYVDELDPPSPDGEIGLPLPRHGVPSWKDIMEALQLRRAKQRDR